MTREAPRWSALPRVPSHLVPKPAVYDALDSGSAVTVLRAPQGYGKSAHVSEWLRRTGHPAVWMTARPTGVADDFWTSLLEHLVDAGLADEEAASGLHGRTASAAVRRVLARWRTPFVLVVDRLERVRTARVDAELVDMVLRSPAARLVLCSHPSSDGEHLADLGMDTIVVEGQALALTYPEVARLAIALDAVVADGVVRSLHHDLWGWPGPTRALLATSVATGEMPRCDWSTLSPLFGAQPPTSAETTGFVLQTLVLDEFTAAVAATLSGVETAPALLATLEASGLVRSRPGPDGPAYSYMPFLRSLSTSTEWSHVSSVVRDAHRRAAHILAETPERALHHATSAQDWEQVVEIVDTRWVHLVTTAPSVLKDALAQLPGRYFRAMPRLVTARDVLLQSRNDTIVTLPVRWPARDQTVEPSDLRDVVGVAVGQIVAERRACRFDTASATATRLVAALRDRDGRYRPGTEDALPFALLHAGVAQLAAGNLDAASDDLLACVWSGTGSDLEFVARNAAETVALLEAVRGSAQRAREHLTTAATLAAPSERTATTMDTVAPAVEALLAVDRLDLDAAEKHLEDLPAPGTVEHRRHAAWYVLDLVRAAVLTLRGDLDDACTAIADAVTRAGPPLTAPSFAHTALTSARARVLVAAGNPTHASNLVAEHPLLDDPVLRARLALSAGDPVSAAETCTTALWRRSLPVRERVAVLLVDMEARDALGDRTGAQAALRNAVRASGTDLLQPYALTDRALLERVAAAVPAAHEVITLLRASQVPAHAAPDAAVVELSEREVAVLHELEQTASTETVARRLFVSSNTVKTQLRSLYRKLGATSRSAALAEGARLGYLTGPGQPTVSTPLTVVRQASSR